MSRYSCIEYFLAHRINYHCKMSIIVCVYIYIYYLFITHLLLIIINNIICKLINKMSLQVRMDREKRLSWLNFKERITTREAEDWSICT